LYFYATGSYQGPVGVAHNISQKSCSKFIEEVTDALTQKQILDKYISFPATRAARCRVSSKSVKIIKHRI
jgi:hypothetical protein